ncbi:putative endoribonuclease YSH1 [Glarea lozoyensis 74030]|uniref:Putative endoribonuclease YSH1 n=1 Tax=Glarea lozoyensis (strain ATCC 74030 / MF5533) TaxID=1104152 RepID=H0EPU3_GLAL7|nr:putative endoribonuclease YSH1 [Glarea lozoyensis 74030]
MNDNIKRLFRERMAEAEASNDTAGRGGPWDFKYIRSLKNLDRFDDVGSCVMLASPGMLQNGVTHVDGTENREFIEEVAAPVVILVHGEQHNMMRLKSKLLSLNADKTTKVKVYSPRNCEEVRIPFKADKIAKVVGKLAAIPPPSAEESQSQLLTGVLVQNDFKMSLMAPEDLREYAGLTTTTITCKQRMTLSAAGIDLIKWALQGTFGSIQEITESQPTNGTNGDSNMNESEEPVEEIVRKSTAYLVMDCVTVRHSSNGEVELEWEGNMLNDGIADAVMAVLFSVESSPAAVKQSSSKHPHTHALPSRNPHANLSPTERLERLFMFLEAQFGADNLTPIATPKDGDDEEEIQRLHKIGIPVPGVEIKVDKMVAKVWLEDLEVECGNRVFGDRVKAVVERAVEVTAPLWATRTTIFRIRI